MSCKTSDEIFAPIKGKKNLDYIIEKLNSIESVNATQNQDISKLLLDVESLKETVESLTGIVDENKYSAVMGLFNYNSQTGTITGIKINPTTGTSTDASLVFADSDGYLHINSNLKFTGDPSKYLSANGTWENVPEIPEVEDLKVTECVYSELVDLYNDGLLIPGMWYRITDYVTSILKEGALSMQRPFDVLVLATSSSTLSNYAKLVKHEGDTYYTDEYLEGCKVIYKLEGASNFTNNKNTFIKISISNPIYSSYNGIYGYYVESGTTFRRWRKLSEGSSIYDDVIEYDDVYVNTNRNAPLTKASEVYLGIGPGYPKVYNSIKEIHLLSTGDIIYMEDAYGNYASYDFTNIVFHWEIDGNEFWAPTLYNAEETEEDQEVTIYQNAIYSMLHGGYKVFNNKISPFMIDGLVGLNHISIAGIAKNNIFGPNFQLSIFMGSSNQNNSFKGNSFDNIVYNDFENNSAEYGFNGNKIHSPFNNNVIGNEFEENTFYSDSVEENVFGNFFVRNNFTKDSNNTTNVNRNVFGNNCYNIYLKNTEGNTFGNDIINCSFANIQNSIVEGHNTNILINSNINDSTIELGVSYVKVLNTLKSSIIRRSVVGTISDIIEITPESGDKFIEYSNYNKTRKI